MKMPVRSRNLIPVYGISGLLTSHLRSRLQLQSVQLRVALHRLVRSLGSKAATSGEADPPDKNTYLENIWILDFASVRYLRSTAIPCGPR